MTVSKPAEKATAVSAYRHDPNQIKVRDETYVMSRAYNGGLLSVRSHVFAVRRIKLRLQAVIMIVPEGEDRIVFARISVP